MKNLQIKSIMTSDPVFISPDDTLYEAAKRMNINNCGFLPVIESGDLLGAITDRDIVTRAVAKGADPKKEKVIHYMSHDCFGCNEDDYIEDAAEKMRDYEVSRLAVRNRAGNVVGILSLGGILRNHADPKEMSSIMKHVLPSQIA